MDITLQVTNEDGVDVIRYVGPINEEAEVHLAQLLPKIGESCEINFSQVEYVNSCGVRAWINFMRDLEKDRTVRFAECTPEIVMQINMIPSFKGSAKIASVYGSYECDGCGHNEKILFEAGKNLPEEEDFELTPVSCPKCSEEMEMEELEEEYFAFMAA